jgi:hypothetical protein
MYSITLSFNTNDGEHKNIVISIETLNNTQPTHPIAQSNP